MKCNRNGASEDARKIEIRNCGSVSLSSFSWSRQEYFSSLHGCQKQSSCTTVAQSAGSEGQGDEAIQTRCGRMLHPPNINQRLDLRLWFPPIL
jgi:hypothetical protein